MLSVYADGGGGENSGFGYFVRETGESFYEKRARNYKQPGRIHGDYRGVEKICGRGHKGDHL